ncbi:MAG: PspC domain-containing protein [Alkalispirochaeta sp.]
MDYYQPPEKRKLYRSRVSRKISGVCGGIAEYFNIDVTLVRLAFVALFLLGGGGVLIYVIAALVLEDNPYQ